MNTLMVGYDLNRPGQNYADLIKHLKSHGNWCHPADSTWLLKTVKNAAQLRDEIKRFVDSGDGVLVVNVTDDDWATLGLSKEINEWFQKYL